MLFHQVWTGLNDRSTEGEFTWSDGNEFDFQNWETGAPSTSTADNCVKFTDGAWNDTSCTEAEQFVCKKSD